MLRSSSSGLSAITSACGGSVRGGITSTSFNAYESVDLRVEQRVDDRGSAARARSPGSEPPHDAAEADDPDAVAALEVLVRRATRPRARPGRACRSRSRRTSAKLSRKSTTSLFRSGCCSFTHSSPRRALTRQLTRRTRSPGANGRRSANSIPSPVRPRDPLPANGCVSSGRDEPTQRARAAGTRAARRRPVDAPLVDERGRSGRGRARRTRRAVARPSAAQRRRSCERPAARRREPDAERARRRRRARPRAGAASDELELVDGPSPSRARASPSTSSPSSAASPVERERDRRASGARASASAEHEDERERRAERGQLRPAEDERGEERRARRAPRRRRAAARRSASRRSARASSAAGAGTVSRHVAHDRLGPHAPHPQLGLQREPVAERRHGDRLHVVGR